MANFNKSFNFRNGVQVDDDNFVVNPNGQVGIGSTVPTEFFDLHGNAVITGSTATGSINAGIGTVGVLTATTAGVGTLAVDEIQIDGLSLRTIVGYHTTGWIIDYAYGGDENPGGYGAGSGISTTIKVGIGTTQAIGKYDLLVGGDPAYGRFNGGGVAFAYGSIHAAGIITASQHFVGVGSLITQINADGIAYGTINDARLPDTITSDLIGDVTGTATTARSLTDHPAIAVTSIVATGVITSTGLDINGAADMISAQIGDLTVAGASILDGPISGDQISLDSAVIGVSTINSRLHLSGSANLGIGSEIPGKTIDIIRDNASINIEAPTSAARLFLVSDNADANVNIVSLTNANVDIASSANTNINIDSIVNTNVNIGSTGDTTFDVDSTNLSFDIDSSENMSVDIDTVGNTTFGVDSTNLSVDIDSSENMSVDIDTVGNTTFDVNSTNLSFDIHSSEDTNINIDSIRNTNVDIGSTESTSIDINSSNSSNIDLISGVGTANVYINSAENGATVSIGASNDATLRVNSYASDAYVAIGASGAANFDLHSDNDLVNVDITALTAASLDLTSTDFSAAASITGNHDASLNVHSIASNQTATFRGDLASNLYLTSDSSTANLFVSADGSANIDATSINDSVNLNLQGENSASATIQSNASTAGLDITGYGEVDVDILSVNERVGFNVNASGIASGQIRSQNNTANLDIIANDAADLDIVSLNDQARIRFSNYVGLADTSAYITFGAEPGFFDIVNNDTGGIRFVLDNTPAGVYTGSFSWKYGSILESDIMTLTYDGRLGIGLTDPTETLQVGGGLTVSDKSYFTDIDATGVITATQLHGDGSGITNLTIDNPLSTAIDQSDYDNTVSAASSFKLLHIINLGQGVGASSGIASIGIGTDDPLIGCDGTFEYASFKGVGINTFNPPDHNMIGAPPLPDSVLKPEYIKTGAIALGVEGMTMFTNVGIGTTLTSYNLGIKNATIDIGGVGGSYSDYTKLYAHNSVISLGIRADLSDSSGGGGGYGSGSADYITDSGTLFIGCKSTIVHGGLTDDYLESIPGGRSIFDFGNVGIATTLAPMILPTVTTSDRATIRNYVSSGATVAGSIIFNSDTGNFEGYNGSSWVTLG